MIDWDLIRLNLGRMECLWTGYLNNLVRRHCFDVGRFDPTVTL